MSPPSALPQFAANVGRREKAIREGSDDFGCGPRRDEVVITLASVTTGVPGSPRKLDNVIRLAPLGLRSLEEISHFKPMEPEHPGQLSFAVVPFLPRFADQ